MKYTPQSLGHNWPGGLSSTDYEYACTSGCACADSRLFTITSLDAYTPANMTTDLHVYMCESQCVDVQMTPEHKPQTADYKSEEMIHPES